MRLHIPAVAGVQQGSGRRDADNHRPCAHSLARQASGSGNRAMPEGYFARAVSRGAVPWSSATAAPAVTQKRRSARRPISRSRGRQDLWKGRNAPNLPKLAAARTPEPTALSSLSPHAQQRMRGNAPEVLAGRQHRELVTDAELCEQRVEGTDLHTGPTTAVAQLRGSDVILPVRAEERQAAFLVRSPLTSRARSIRSGARERLVAMCDSLHNTLHTGLTLASRRSSMHHAAGADRSRSPTRDTTPGGCKFSL